MSDQPETPSPATTARHLMRAVDRAALATSLGTEAGKWPYGSLVLVASDLDASPLLLLSALAEHTKNLARDPRASLLFDGTAGRDDPLTGARVTVVGEVAPLAEGGALERFLRRHPAARAYAGFKDFGLYRMKVARAHLVAGFGRIDWIPAAELLLEPKATDWLRDAEASILQHMNADHADAVDLYAQRLLGRNGAGWQMTGIDPEGCDLRHRGQTARLDFPTPIDSPESVRQAFVILTQFAKNADPNS